MPSLSSHLCSTNALEPSTFPLVSPPLPILLYFSLQTSWYLFSVIFLPSPKLPCPLETHRTLALYQSDIQATKCCRKTNSPRLDILGASYGPASFLCVLINSLPHSQQIFHTSTTQLKIPFLYSYTLWMICFLLHRGNWCQGQSSCSANYPLTCRQRVLASFPTHTWIKEASYLLTEVPCVLNFFVLYRWALIALTSISLSLFSFQKFSSLYQLKKLKTKTNFS